MSATHVCRDPYRDEVSIRFHINYYRGMIYTAKHKIKDLLTQIDYLNKRIDQDIALLEELSNECRGGKKDIKAYTQDNQERFGFSSKGKA
jgi:hypothetical protein